MPDTMEHPGGAMGLTKYLQAREDAISTSKVGGRGRLRATASPLCSIKHWGVGGGRRAGGETVTCGRAAGGNSSSFLAGVTRPATARRMNSRRSRG